MTPSRPHDVHRFGFRLGRIESSVGPYRAHGVAYNKAVISDFAGESEADAADMQSLTLPNALMVGRGGSLKTIASFNRLFPGR